MLLIVTQYFAFSYRVWQQVFFCNELNANMRSSVNFRDSWARVRIRGVTQKLGSRPRYRNYTETEKIGGGGISWP